MIFMSDLKKNHKLQLNKTIIITFHFPTFRPFHSVACIMLKRKTGSFSQLQTISIHGH